MNDYKFFTGIAAMLLVALGVMLFFAGLPSSKVQMFEESGIVCKSWDETWNLGKYQFKKCYKTIEVQK